MGEREGEREGEKADRPAETLCSKQYNIFQQTRWPKDAPSGLKLLVNAEDRETQRERERERERD